MSFSELRCFNAVARMASFSHAAEFLRRSQPNITIQVGQLEKRYGVELLHRKRAGGVTLTPLGEKLYGITKQMLMLEQDAVALLESAGKQATGDLRIGAIAPRSATIYLSKFKARFSSINVSLCFGNSEAVLADVLASRVDVGILGGHGSDPNCQTTIISRPEIVLLTTEAHPAARTGFLGREAFSRETLLLREKGSETRDLVMSRMAQAKYEPRAIIEIGSREGVCAAAVAGLGVAVVSAEEVELTPATRIVRFEDFSVFGTMHAMCLKRRENIPSIKAFLSLIRAHHVQTA